MHPTILVALLTALSLPLCAQDVTATLNGTVRDASAAVVPNAAVSVTNEATGAKRQVQSNSDGYFALTDLQIGSYSLAVELAGFKTYRQHGITVTAGQIRSLGELRLAVGDLAETVSVEADIVAVSLASGEKSGVITGKD